MTSRRCARRCSGRWPTPRRDAAYQVGIFVSGDGTRGVPYRESLAGKTVAVVGLGASHGRDM